MEWGAKKAFLGSMACGEAIKMAAWALVAHRRLGVERRKLEVKK